MRSRRDFLRLLGMAAGVSLSGCGGQSDNSFSAGVPSGAIPPGGPNPGPLAYRYIKVAKSGDALPGGVLLAPKQVRFSLQSDAVNPPPFMGGVMLTDSRHIYFHGLDETQKRGIYRIDVDDRGNRSECKKVIREGDVLPDGTIVDDFSDGDVNNGDDFVISTVDPEGVNSLQCATGGGPFRMLARSGSQLGTTRLAEDLDESQVVTDDGQILFVAEYLDDEGFCQGEGLFVMPVGQPQQARRILAAGDRVPGTGATSISCFGAIEMCPGGRYMVQGTATRADSSTIDPTRPVTFILQGIVGQTPELVACDAEIAGAARVRIGSSFMCPRLSPDSLGFVLQIQRNNPDATQMIINNQVRGSANLGGTLTGTAPGGGRVLSFLPPAFGPGGVAFYEVCTTEGMAVLRFDPESRETTRVLGTQDVVDGKKVETVVFGALPDCVNKNQEFVAIVEFDDGETDVYLGIPA